MLHTVFGCLQRKVSDVKALVEEAEASRVVYRDELTKKQGAGPCSNIKGRVKKSVRFADSEARVLGETDQKEKIEKKGENNTSNGEREGMRVKVKMTKEEAARLLSRCKQGGLLEFKDLARELVSIPLNRVTIVHPISTNNKDHLL